MTVLTAPTGTLPSWGFNYLLLDGRGNAVAAFAFKADLEKYQSDKMRK